ncbi:MAG: hypothetical protein KJ592_03100 [Nanoarchaeota archaeon]|nr:hypothetical protein [Nanoarchaeota archaeon]
MFKNWLAISVVVDVHFRWALALLDLKSEFGQKIARQNPEYFCEEKLLGPVPLSAIIQRSRDEYSPDGFSEEYVVSNDTFKYFGIPVFEFASEWDTKKDYPDLSLLPEEIDLDRIDVSSANASIGMSFEWQGKELVLLEYNDITGIVSFVPAECVDVDK